MSPQRIQRKRTKGWKMPENTVYVGRGSKWGNPWRVGDTATICADHVVSGETRFVRAFEITAVIAVEFYRIAYTLETLEACAELAGKNLACWCPESQPCHADVLLELANR